MKLRKLEFSIYKHFPKEKKKVRIAEVQKSAKGMNMTAPPPPQTVELDNVLILIIIGHKGEQKRKICEDCKTRQKKQCSPLERAR